MFMVGRCKWTSNRKEVFGLNITGLDVSSRNECGNKKTLFMSREELFLVV